MSDLVSVESESIIIKSNPDFTNCLIEFVKDESRYSGSIKQFSFLGAHKVLVKMPTRAIFVILASPNIKRLVSNDRLDSATLGLQTTYNPPFEEQFSNVIENLGRKFVTGKKLGQRSVKYPVNLTSVDLHQMLWTNLMSSPPQRHQQTPPHTIVSSTSSFDLSLFHWPTSPWALKNNKLPANKRGTIIRRHRFIGHFKRWKHASYSTKVCHPFIRYHLCISLHTYQIELGKFGS
ncbi:hypothetical protein L1887_14955 [Cichorium endivia]|nr:hypothetical protein L1887_14955 [Cichorium endivia]